jgi:acetyl-CoA synthetase
VLITSDEGRRGGKTIATKAIADAALKECPLVEHVLVLRRTGNSVLWTAGRDKWWHEETLKVPSYCPPEVMSAEDPLFILYVSPIIFPLLYYMLRHLRLLVLRENQRVSFILLPGTF